MNTSEPVRLRRTPLEEASDPDTDPERLRELADNEEVVGLVLRNPSVPEDIWRKGLLDGWPEAWDNPVTPLYLIAWTSRKNEIIDLEMSAMIAATNLLENPSRSCAHGKELINAKLIEWWDTSESPAQMMAFLGHWARSKGIGSAAHREVVRILVICIRTVPKLTSQDRDALELLDTWQAGGQNRNETAASMASSEAVKKAARFAQDTSNRAWDVINKILFMDSFEHLESEEDWNLEIDRKSRKIADLIRSTMKMPPIVE